MSTIAAMLVTNAVWAAALSVLADRYYKKPRVAMALVAIAWASTTIAVGVA